MKGFHTLSGRADKLVTLAEAELTAQHDSATPSRGQWAAPPHDFTASLPLPFDDRSLALLDQSGPPVARQPSTPSTPSTSIQDDTGGPVGNALHHQRTHN